MCNLDYERLGHANLIGYHYHMFSYSVANIKSKDDCSQSDYEIIRSGPVITKVTHSKIDLLKGLSKGLSISLTFVW